MKQGDPRLFLRMFAFGQTIAAPATFEGVGWDVGGQYPPGWNVPPSAPLGAVGAISVWTFPRVGLWRVVSTLSWRGAAGTTGTSQALATLSSFTDPAGPTTIVQAIDNVPVGAGANHSTRLEAVIEVVNPAALFAIEAEARGGLPSIAGSQDSRLELEWLGRS